MNLTGLSARRFRIFGALFLIGGLAALLVPPIAGLTVTLLLGWLFLIGGTLQTISALSAPRSEAFWVKLLWSLLYVAVGLWIVIQPTEGIQALAFALALLFIFDSGLKFYFAWQRRGRLHGGWLVTSGILSAILAVILLAGWPETSAMLLGIFVGVNLVMNGVLALVLASDIRDLQSD